MTIDLPGDPPPPPRVVDIGSDGCQLHWGMPWAPSVPLGMRFQGTVCFNDVEPAFPITMQAMSRAEAPSGRTYSFEFGLRDSVRDEFVQALMKTFNRRAAHRVKPDPLTAIKAVLSLKDGRYDTRGRIRDISGAGIAIIAEADADRNLAESDVLRVRIGLTTEPIPLDLEGKVVGRQVVPEGILYRLHFMLDRCSNDAEIRSRILEYVKQRQRDVIREA